MADDEHGPVADAEAANGADIVTALVDAELFGYRGSSGLERPNGAPDMNANPLTFWQQAERAEEFPILRRLARRYLAIPASSASAERLFSYTGNRVSKRACRLSDEQLLAQMYVRTGSRFIVKWARAYPPSPSR